MRSLSFFRADWPRGLATLGMLAVSTGLGLLKPWPLAWIVDSFLGHRPLPEPLAAWLGSPGSPRQLTLLVGLLAALHWGHAGASALQNGSIILIGLRGLARVRRAIFDGLLRLSLKCQQNLETGDLIYRATWDACAFQTLVQHGVFTSIAASVGVVSMTLVMMQLNGRLTLVALATVPILVWGIRGFSARMGRLAGEAQSADAGIATAVQQLLAALPLVQSFTRERSEAERFQQRTERSLATRWSQHRTEVLYLAVVAGILAAGTAAIAWTGATEVAAGRLAVGHLLVFLAYLGQLYEPLNQLSNVGATVSVARAGTGRVLEFLDAAAGGPAEGTLDSSRVAAPPEIRFETVTAGYREGNPVLKQFDLTIPAGETVAIVGPSGAGKTTLLSLVSRFLDPDSGRVMFGGVDVRELRLEALRGLVAWVPQEPILLPGTVAENIGFGRAGASREEIVSAARAAHADEFIQRLPSGYDTQVGDGAARLSSGEKQRLNLARAFLKRAPVLLLDEPTSALDSESEALILESLRAWSKGRTVMMVAHRLRTLSVAHRIVVVRDGTLLEQGTREDLVARGGYFATVLENG